MKKTAPTMLLATLALLLASCEKKTETTTTKTETTTTETTTDSAAGGETSTAPASNPADTYTIQSAGDVPTLETAMVYDTGSALPISNIYETLVTYKGNSLTEVEPLLATEWKVSDDGKEYRFVLRKDVKFHSGNPFTCADAEYTIRRNMVTNHPESSNWFIAESLFGSGSNGKENKDLTWKKITEAIKCDGEDLVLTLAKPDNAFLSKMAYVGQSIVDSKYAIELGEWDGTEKTWKDNIAPEGLGNSALSQKPSGTGPYKLVRKDANALVAEAFPDYWGEKGSIKKVLMQVVPEASSRIQAFLKGDADDVATGGRAATMSQVVGKPHVVFEQGMPTVDATAMVFNQKVKGNQNLGSGKLDGQGIPADFFSDVHVRKAFIAAFDYDTYIKDMLVDQGAKRNFLLPESFLGYDETLEPQKFDMEAAKKEFEQAWGGEVWKNGFTITATYESGAQVMQGAFEMLKRNVESINPKFKLNIVPKQWSEYIASANAGKEALSVNSWSADYADPDNFVRTFYHSKGSYAPRININNPELDKLVDDAYTAKDEAKRKELYTEIAKKGLDEGYFLIMPTIQGIILHRDNLTGINKDTYNPMRPVPWNKLTKK